MVDKVICRFCCKNIGTINIFDGHKVQISNKIKLCCSTISIVKDDGLPSFICNICNRDLDASYKFAQKCEASDRILRLRKNEGNNSDNALNVEIQYEQGNECNDSNDNESLDSPRDKNSDLIKPKIKNEFLKETKEKPVSIEKHSESLCSVCGCFCTSNTTLVKHKQVHIGKKLFPCQACDKVYKTNKSLSKHKDTTHHSKIRSRNFICENCGKGFFSKNDVKIHLRIHTGETPYACKQCPMRFTQISTYLRHQKRHSGIKSYSCSTCSKMFCTKEELKMHSNVHSDEKNYSCSICNTPFKYRNNLKKHLQLHSQPNNFICNHCGRTFNVKGNLKIHIDRIHSSKSGHCTLCSKHVANMEVHMWKHSGERPLKCELCSSSFYDLKALAIHVSFRHKNKEKYKCTFNGCTMAFPSKPMLDFHTAKLHETGIPYPCDKCSRGFYRKNDLARHKIGTHKERLG